MRTNLKIAMPKIKSKGITTGDIICFVVGSKDSAGVNNLRGYCTLNHKLACFVLYLKIINTLLKNNICTLKQIVLGTQKWY